LVLLLDGEELGGVESSFVLGLAEGALVGTPLVSADGRNVGLDEGTGEAALLGIDDGLSVGV
jgi:hypothetical protein